MELILKLNSRKKESKTLIEFLKSLSFVTIEEKIEPNKTTKKAIEEIEKGKTKKVIRKTDDIIEDILNS